VTGIIAIGVGAGVVSALLTLVIATGSPVALLLFFLAPLPVAIAALGWNHKAGLVAAAVGAIILGVAIHPRTAAVYAVSTALPAWWFSYLALLGRPGADGTMEWYPVGRVLAGIAAVAAVMTMAGVLLIADDYDGYVRAFGRAVDLVERVNPGMFDRVPEPMRAEARAGVAALVAAFAPPASAALSVLITAGLMVFAGRAVLASGRLPRAWPHLPALVLPRAFLPLLGLSIAGAATLGGFAGLAARTLLASLIAAYAIQGFALLHALTAGKPGRAAMLAGAYAVSVLFAGWPLVLMALGGAADALFNIRARRGLAPMAS
jgi:hypothetical protein